jgi:hypothetical protein
MSLWSFQGARGLLRRTRGCRRPPLIGQSRSLKTQQRTQISRSTYVLGELSYLTIEIIKGLSAYRSKSSGFPRKEVIQPQLPLRLPCYDFTPIIDPTLDGSLPCGLGHRLRVLPTFVV